MRLFRVDKYSALYLWAAFMTWFGLTRSDTFLTGTTLKLVLSENVIIGVLALAFLVPLTTGTYDLSIGAMMAMALVITTSLAKNNSVSPIAGIFIALAACAVAGVISGFFVVKMRVNSFIATLGMSQVITAFVLYVSDQSISGVFDQSYLNIGQRKFLGQPLFVYYLFILAIVIWFVLEHTPVGRYMFATGGNPEAARLAGVRTDRLVWGSLVASALIAGFSGIIFSWKVGNFSQSIGPGFLFPAVAAVFFGASQLKGRPNVWGTLIALYALAWGVKGLQLTFSSNTIWIEPLFQGLSLLAAVSLASYQGVVKVRKRKTDDASAPTAPVLVDSPPRPDFGEGGDVGVAHEPVAGVDLKDPTKG
jgi:ribose transport system permease protein